MKTVVTSLLLIVMLIFLIPLAGCKTAPKSDNNQADLTPPDRTATTAPTKVVTTPPTKTTTTPPVKTPPSKTTPTKTTKYKKGGLLVADKPVHDFNDVEPSKSLKGKFILTNKGAEPLDIKRPIRTSCGCTVTRMQQYTLKAGESSPLEVTYRVGSHPGRMTKTISIDTVSPAEPDTLVLKVTANVIEVVSVSPKRFDFELRADPKLKYVVELESYDKIPFNITGQISHSGAITAQIDTQKRATKHSIPLTINPDKLRTLRSGAITFNLNHPKLKYVSVPYRATLPYAAHPPTKAFLRMTPGATQTASVKIISNFGESFELGEITASSDRVAVTNQSKTDDGYQIDFRYTVPNNTPKTIYQDFLLIHIKDQVQNTIKMPCYARILRTASRLPRRDGP